MYQVMVNMCVFSDFLGMNLYTARIVYPELSDIKDADFFLNF